MTPLLLVIQEIFALLKLLSVHDDKQQYACVDGKSRLSHLALLHIHYDAEVDLDEVVDCYGQLHPRRLELQSILH